jgi:hypothetical protein
MSKPDVELYPEPMQDDVVTFQLLAGTTKDHEAVAQISLLLKVKNREAKDIVLTNVKISVIFSDNRTPQEIGFPVTTRIPAGKSAYWHNRVFTAKPEETGLPDPVAINQNILAAPLAHIIVFKLTFRDFTEKVTKMYALRQHKHPTTSHAYAFPARARDLMWNECWDSAGAVHGESEYGCQLFALDLGVSSWDEDSDTWIRNVYPGKSGAENDHHRIWGKPVYAMSDGELIGSRWDFPDNEKPSDELTKEIKDLMDAVGDGGGNYVQILTGDEIHGYSHFMKDTVPERLRTKGVRVEKGDLLGLVGNSGSSTQPHLHIGVERRRRVVVKGDHNATHVLRPMQFKDVYTISSKHAKGVRREDPWFRNTSHGLSVVGNDSCLIWPSALRPGSPRLKLKEFRCVEETDAEFGAESPHFIVFVGRRAGDRPQSRTFRIRKGAWDNQVDEGELWVANEDITGPVDGKSLVMVAMIEEDNDPDISGDRLTMLRRSLREAFRDAAKPGVTLEALAAVMTLKMTVDLGHLTSSDEILGVKQLPITTTDGDLPLLRFNGDGARYNVRFEMVE